MKIKVIRRTKGGPGSGNWGHSGRPGLVGGSNPGGGKGVVPRTTNTTITTVSYIGGTENAKLHRDALEDGIFYGWEGIRKDAALGAVSYMNKPGYIVKVLRDSGTVKGIISIDKEGYMDYMATKEPGYGRKTITMAAEHAVGAGTDLAWHSLIAAVPFYNHIGFGEYREFQDEDYLVPHADLVDWLDQQGGD